MDILKARKKAAERKELRLKEEAPQPPVEKPTQEAGPVPVMEMAPAVAVQAPVAGPSAGPSEILPTEAPLAEAAPGEAPAEPEATEQELLTFRLGEEAYAVLVNDVREVLKTRELTPVPNTPAYILGVTSLRGAMLPVIDLCPRLGLAPGVRDEKSRIIVVNTGEEDVGLVVDRVTGVLRVSADAIRPAPENIEQGAEYLRGIIRQDDVLYILLDLEKATRK